MNEFKLVPVEPTPEMVRAAREFHEGEAYLPASLYKAMIEASPAVQGEPVSWQCVWPGGGAYTTGSYESAKNYLEGAISSHGEDHAPFIRPLYTAPQPAEQKPKPGVAVQGELVAITDADILAIAGKIESCPVSLWWLKDDVAIGDVQAAVLRFARALLTAAPQPTEQQPVSHDWDDQDKCRRCGDRDWYASATCTPKQQPAQDVTALVEALEEIAQSCDSGRHDGLPEDGPALSDVEAWLVANDALAAYRQGGGR